METVAFWHAFCSYVSDSSSNHIPFGARSVYNRRTFII